MKPALLGLRGAPVESYFMKANAPDGSRALWTRCTVFRQPGLPAVAEAWAIAFDRHRGHVAVKSTVPFSEARFAKKDFDVEVDGCSLSLERAKGRLESGRGELAWALGFGPTLAEIQHLPTLAYRDELPSSKLVSPIADARATGVVEVKRGAGDVDTWNVEEWPMMVGHNWGRANAELYAWSHCNVWESAGDKTPMPGLVFEALSARVRMGPVLSPMMTMVFLRYRGKSWNLAGPRSLGRNRGHLSLRRWEVTSNAEGLELACDVAAETDDVVGLHYANPSGPMTYCFNTKLGRARLDVRLPDGTSFTALSRAAALEIGTLKPDQSVRMAL
jgi:hypothetical protein